MCNRREIHGKLMEPLYEDAMLPISGTRAIGLVEFARTNITILGDDDWRPGSADIKDSDLAAEVCTLKSVINGYTLFSTIGRAARLEDVHLLNALHAKSMSGDHEPLLAAAGYQVIQAVYSKRGWLVGKQDVSADQVWNFWQVLRIKSALPTD